MPPALFSSLLLRLPRLAPLPSPQLLPLYTSALRYSLLHYVLLPLRCRAKPVPLVASSIM